MLGSKLIHASERVPKDLQELTLVPRNTNVDLTIFYLHTTKDARFGVGSDLVCFRTFRFYPHCRYTAGRDIRYTCVAFIQSQLNMPNVRCLTSAQFRRRTVKIILIALVFIIIACTDFIINIGNVEWACEGCFPRPYSFSIHPKRVCHHARSPDILIMVMSRPKDQSKRGILRRTILGLTRNNTDLGVQHVFAIGATASPSTQHLLVDENDKHGDIVQQNFTDAYFNLTLKTLAALEWATSYCPGAGWIMKLDDDVYLNMGLLDEMRRNYGNTHTLLCHRNFPVRTFAKHKTLWSLTSEEYPYYFFPAYCNGPMYLLHQSVAKYIIHVSPNKPFLKFEDVYIGLCLASSPFSIGHLRYTAHNIHGDVLLGMDCDQIHDYVYIHSVPIDVLERIWKRCEKL